MSEREPISQLQGLNPADEGAAGDAQTGEALCPRCSGSGRLPAGDCPDCGGTGRIIQIVGDA
jgi:DnaJ-class molecular chaperone